MTSQHQVESVTSHLNHEEAELQEITVNSEKTTVNVPPVIDTVSIEILLVVTLELFKFQTCKQSTLYHRKCINERYLDYFPNVFWISMSVLTGISSQFLYC